MAFNNRRNSGALFNERDKKKGPNDRDYGGRIDIEGRQYWLSAWINTSKQGLKYLSLSAKAVDAQSAKGDLDDDPF
jgi:hypothetical protein